MIGNLESKNVSSFRFSNPKNAIHQPNKSALFTKKNIETQLKSIIKSNPIPHAARSTATSLSYKDAKSNLFLAKSIASFQDDEMYSNRQKELLTQIENHSFKDLSLIPIKPHTAESIPRNKMHTEIKIPTIKNTYNVKVLKKPFSMKWLNSRRLSLFLQSDFYNEFRLAMLLTQIDLDNDSGNLF